MPAGPGARELTEFFATIDAGLASYETALRVVASDQHVLNLLSKRAQALHLTATNYCWFTDPSRALCLKLAGRDAALRDLEQFKALAISRLAAQHDEITRLRRQATAAKASNVRTLTPRTPAPADGTIPAGQETP